MPRQAKEFAECPHKDAIQFCPLYVAAHSRNPTVLAMTCMDAHMETDYGVHCAVERMKMDFAGAVAGLRIADPLLVGHCEFGKMRHDAKEQVARNMRAAGIH